MIVWVRHAGFRVLPVVLAIGFLLEMIRSFQRSSALSWQAHGLLIGVAIPFLLVGSLVWYTGHQRRLSCLFFGHCAAVVLCCLFWPLAPAFKDLILLLVLGAVALLFHFLWYLPHQYLALLAEDAPRRARVWRLVRILTDSGGGMGGAGGILLLSRHGWSPLLEPWLAMGALLYLSVGWWWSWVAYRGTEEPRERQQLRLVWMGTVVAVLPPLGLLVLPRLFHVPGDPLWLSLLALPVFPFVLGYAILRFQLFVPDRIIQRVAFWFLRGLLFPLLIALIVGTGLTLFALPSPALAIFLALSLACLGPLLWWGICALVPLLFAQDMPSLAAFLHAPPPRCQSGGSGLLVDQCSYPGKQFTTGVSVLVPGWPAGLCAHACLRGISAWSFPPAPAATGPSSVGSRVVGAAVLFSATRSTLPGTGNTHVALSPASERADERVPTAALAALAHG